MDIDGSRRLASMVGPVLVVVAGSLMLNPAGWADSTPNDAYQMGLILFIGGMFLVRYHNRWSVGWPLILTMVGWFLLASGVVRLYLTAFAVQSAPIRELPFQAGLLGVGVFLTVMGFWPSRRT